MDDTNNHTIIYGAFASIIIIYDGSLRQLAEKLAVSLNLNAFEIETSESPPHEEVGSAEAMGWEAWLNTSSEAQGRFCLRMETEHSISEIYEGRMFNLSPWLARLVTTLCEVQAFPERPHSSL